MWLATTHYGMTVDEAWLGVTRNAAKALAMDAGVLRPGAPADLVIWLDYPFPLVFWRLLIRTIRRLALQEELWNGNRERLWDHLRLWSKDSLFNWLFQSHWRHRREYPELFAMPEYADLHVLRFATPGEADSWFTGL